MGLLTINTYNSKFCTKKYNNATKLPFTCMSSTALRKIAKTINKLNKNTISMNKSDKELYDQIKHFMKGKYSCDKEYCWIKVKELMKELKPTELDYIDTYFKPILPKELVKDYTEWLSNYNIQDVLSRYSKLQKEFYFYGAIPIDFHKCSVSKLCNINIKDHLNKGESKIGIVFNTDDSTKPGKHWIAMYIDLLGKNLNNVPGIYFFDSFGGTPMKEIKNLISKLQSQYNNKFFVSYNDKSFQKNTYACGFYCMHFIESMLSGINFKSYLKSGLNDKLMKSYLNTCYLHPKEIKC